MKFSGRLQIETDPRNWLKTDLNLSQGRLELVSGGDILGSWSTAQVKAERVDGDRFQLHLGEDRAVFAADDALAFSYEALPALTKKPLIPVPTGLRGKLRKGLAGADRSHQPDPQLESEPAPSPVAVIQPEETIEDTESPQPTRKLRDLIQAAVRSNAAEASAAEGAWRETESTAPEVDELAHSAGNDEVYIEVVAPDPAWPEADGVVSDVPPTNGSGVVTGVGEPLSPSPRESSNAQDDRPAFDLTPAFPESDASHESPDRTGRRASLLGPEATVFEGGETLGDRPAAPFGWNVAAEEPQPAEPAIAPTQVIRTLDTLIKEVRNGGLSPAQVGAISDLIRAVADAVGGKNTR